MTVHAVHIKLVLREEIHVKWVPITMTLEWSSSLGLDEMLIIPHCKNPACYEMLHRPLELVGMCEHGNQPSKRWGIS